MRLTFIADPPDNALRDIGGVVHTAIRARNLDALINGVEHAGSASTLDIIAHTSDSGLMRLGSVHLDPDDRTVVTPLGAALSKHGITSLRLLGCRSACGQGGAIVVALADLLGVQVFGSIAPLMPRHFDSSGFRPEYDSLLAPDRLLRRVSMKRSSL